MALSDVVVISKGDISGEGLGGARHGAAVNAAAECMTAVRGSLAPEHLFAVGGAHRSGDSARRRRWLSLESDDNADAHRHYASDVQADTMCFERPATHAGLAVWLTMLGCFVGPSLLRMKDIVNVEGEAYVVRVVQSVVHEPVRLKVWAGLDRHTRVSSSSGAPIAGRSMHRHRLLASRNPLARMRCMSNQRRMQAARDFV